MSPIHAKEYDVIVVGAGNAGLCAAIAALENSASVLILEKAPDYLQGGNSFFTNGAFRFVYDDLIDIRALMPDMSEQEASLVDVGTYTHEGFYSDLMRITEGMADQELTQVLVSESFPTMKWLHENGVRWALRYGRQAYKVNGIFKFWGGVIVESVGAGKGLVEALTCKAKRLGAKISFSTRATELLMNEKGRICGLVVQGPEGVKEIHGSAVVVACGGFGASAEWRAKYLGPGWDLAKVEGTPFNTGDGLRMALDVGAQSYGHWSGCHALAWDVNAPSSGDRNVAALYHKPSYPLGMVVNRQGKRFQDEGVDFRSYTYAKQGIYINNQPGRIAFQVFDSKVRSLLAEQYFLPQANMVQADSLEELAEQLGIDKEGFLNTVVEFNAAVQEGHFDPTVLDGKRTKGISPPKSNWAQRIDTRPYIGCAVTVGLTFTYGGIKINKLGRVLDSIDVPIAGLYAAGEMVGGLFYHNYAAGSGLMAGSVFGHIAGINAAKEALGRKA